MPLSQIFHRLRRYKEIQRITNIKDRILYLCKKEDMKGVIQIEYPESLANTLKLTGKDFESEMKTCSLVKLFELGKVSSGVAAKVLGLSRVDFLELLSKYNVSVFGAYDIDDLNDDKIILDNIQNLTARSKAFHFLNDEEDLYDENDLKERYK